MPPLTNEGEAASFLEPRTGMRVPTTARKDIDPIAWMKGVKIGKRGAGLDQSISSMPSPGYRMDRGWEDYASLGEEIADVGAKFSKVNFYKVCYAP